MSKWEIVSTGDSSISLSRLRVPGGWIYKTLETNVQTIMMSTCFVPYQFESANDFGPVDIAEHIPIFNHAN